MRNKNTSEHRRKVNFGGIELKVCMTKVRNFVEITPNLPFSEFNFYELYRETFEKSELGRMKKLLPLHEMAEPRSGEQEHDAQAWTEVLLHPWGESGADVPEDEDADEFPEADGGVER